VIFPSLELVKHSKLIDLFYELVFHMLNLLRKLPYWQHHPRCQLGSTTSSYMAALAVPITAQVAAYMAAYLPPNKATTAQQQS
jgi:hypothetical protein